MIKNKSTVYSLQSTVLLQNIESFQISNINYQIFDNRREVSA
jgi:hypothetical protein